MKVTLDPTTGNPHAYFTTDGIANFAATKGLIESNNQVFTIGELNAYNTFATDTFEEWVESIFNRCVFEVLVFRLREMYVGRGVYMTAMTNPSRSSGSFRRRQSESVDDFLVFRAVYGTRQRAALRSAVSRFDEHVCYGPYGSYSRPYG